MEDLVKELSALKGEFNKHVTSITEHITNAITKQDTLNADLSSVRDEFAAIKAEQSAIRKVVDDLLNNASQPARKKARIDKPISSSAVDVNPNGKHQSESELESMDTSGDVDAHVGATTTTTTIKPTEGTKETKDADHDLTKENMKGTLQIEMNGSRIVPDNEDADDEPMQNVEENEKAQESAKESREAEKSVETKDVKVKTVTLGNAPTIKYSEKPSAVVAQPVVNDSSASEKESAATPGKPRGRAPKDSKGVTMQWDTDAAVWRSKSIKNEIKEPRRSSSASATPAVEEEVIEEEMVEASSEEPTAPAAPNPSKPKGRAPHDSVGDPMEWDEDAKVWRSKNDRDETKEPRRPSSATAAAQAEVEPAPAPAPDLAVAAPTTTPVKPKGRAPHDSVGDPMEWDADASVWRSKNDKQETKAPRQAAPVPSPAPVVPTARPRGRPPTDSHGIQMRWDNAAALWRSTKDSNEIKQPNTPRAPKDTKETKGNPASTSEEEDVEEDEQVSSRPAGRAPKDSLGNSMNWNEDKKLWVSASNPAETKTPGKRK